MSDTKHSSTGTAEVTDEMVTAAMRAFELMSIVLRYREADKWHACDVMGMRDAIRAALAAQPSRPAQKARGPVLDPSDEIYYEGYEQARADLSAQLQPQWQPIETAPKDSSYVDLWFDKDEFGPSVARNDLIYGRIPDCLWLGNETTPGWYAEHTEHGPYYIGDGATHWMRRPASPALPSTPSGTEPSAPAASEPSHGG